MTTDAATTKGTQGMQAPWWLILIEGILAIFVGILLFTNTAATTIFLVQVLGIYWLIKGIFVLISIFVDSSMWGWKLFAGIVGILAGLLIITSGPLYSTILVATVAIIVLGIQGLIMGIAYIVMAFKGGGWGIGILGGLSIIVGIILLANTLIAAAVLPFVLGFFLIAGGIIAIVAAFKMR